MRKRENRQKDKEKTNKRQPHSQLDFPGGTNGKEPACNAGGVREAGSIPGLGRAPGEGNGNPLQYSCLENPRQRSLLGYSPWGCKELVTTEVT